ncbi:MAG: hypothetical protein KGL26_09340 [Pseudomonadota bacterium]|nr:hypothetical protein [Pseudomonadota bacterium]
MIESTYPHARELEMIGQTGGFVCTNDDVEETVRERNTFWSWRWRCDVAIYERVERTGVDDGGAYTYRTKIEWCRLRQGSNHATEALNALSVADAWGMDQERRALRALSKLIRPRQMRQYLLTGTFAERSPRSDLTYLFRRLRPTLVISCHGKDEVVRMLCALCMHPIGYYQRSWAGAMVPTDDVIAHLMLMRGDEVMLWRRANQHPLFRHEAGVG